MQLGFSQTTLECHVAATNNHFVKYRKVSRQLVLNDYSGSFVCACKVKFDVYDKVYAIQARYQSWTGEWYRFNHNLIQVMMELV